MPVKTSRGSGKATQNARKRHGFWRQIRGGLLDSVNYRFWTKGQLLAAYPTSPARGGRRARDLWAAFAENNFPRARGKTARNAPDEGEGHASICRLEPASPTATAPSFLTLRRRAIRAASKGLVQPDPWLDPERLCFRKTHQGEKRVKESTQPQLALNNDRIGHAQGEKFHCPVMIQIRKVPSLQPEARTCIIKCTVTVISP